MGGRGKRTGENKGDEKAGRAAESIKGEKRQRDNRQGEQETDERGVFVIPTQGEPAVHKRDLMSL